MPPKQEQDKDDKEENKEDNKEDDGQRDEPKQIVVNGTTINDATTLYGVVTNTQTGQGIENIVVSDGFICVTTDSNGVYQIVRNKNCEMVNISIPAEYEIPVDGGNHPAFYKRFINSKDEKFRHDFALTPLPGGKQSEFTLLTLADIQLNDTNDADRFRDETMPDIDQLLPTLVNPIAVTLGDDTNKNNSAMWTKVKQITANQKVSIFHCMGNHDHLNELSPDDHSKSTTYWKSVENFHKYFGPQNYSFSRSDTHIVVMDNALHGETPPPGEDYEYAAGFYDWQFEWLKQDLSYVPKDKMVLLCVHIPFRDGKGGNHSDERYRQKVLNLLSEYQEVHLLIGHTHKQATWIHTVNGKKIYEHIHGAVCGGMWHSTVCVDGTPNGYGVFIGEGNTFSDWYYMGYNEGMNTREHQLRLHRGNAITGAPRQSKSGTNGTGYYSFNFAEDVIIANVFNADDTWKIEVYEDDVKTGEMKQIATKSVSYDKLIGSYTMSDPRRIASGTIAPYDVWTAGIQVGELNRVGSNGSWIQCYHLYQYKLKNPNAKVRVVAIDRFGNRYSSDRFIDYRDNNIGKKPQN